ncbi:MAG TPA: DUF4332 domain-containing protein [Candidatus Thermoplasmatota archaeon]|nr:DUF4332 domain-containing protein [Candidatus Thermoplasmatota archaeon]
MDLKHVKGIGPAKQEKLREAGIKNAEDLARADVVAVAEKSGIPVATVKEYKERAVALTLLEDLKGMGPATVKTLAESGIQSLQDLYRASAARLAKDLKVAKAKIEAWQKEASQATERIAKEAKTREGRQKIAKESRAMAVEAAHTVEATAKAWVARAQKEAAALQERALEFKAKAPGAIADARGRAEAAYKDAEAKAKAFAGKAQAAVKAEVEKAKAANQQLVERTKARFHKAA